MAEENQKFALNDNCFLVRGAKKGAIYDTKRGDIFSVSQLGLDVLQKCEEDKTVNELYGESPTDRQEILGYLKQVESLGLGGFVPSSTYRTKSALVRPEQKLNWMWLELTEGCNLQCVHCYSGSLPLNDAERKKEMTVDQWKEVIRDGYKSGCRSLQFIGGEPLLYGQGIFPLIKQAKDAGYELVEIFTNSTLLSDPDINLLKKYDVKVATTVYSKRKEIHDTITGQKGSFESTISNAKKMKEKGVDVSFSLIGMSKNQDYIQETVDFLSEEFHTNSIYLDLVRPIGRGTCNELVPDKLSYLGRREKARFPKMKGDFFIKSHFGNTCWSGKVDIKSNGDVTPCVMAREEICGNVKETPLQDILSTKKLLDLWGLSKDKVDTCKDCEYRYGCFDCRPTAKSQTNSLFGKDLDCYYDPYTGEWDDIS